jgi:ABC-type enterochelin transport system permease subunit
VDHYVSLSDLQQIIGRYVDQYNLVVAGGPLAAAGFVRTFIVKNKFVSIALAGSAAWFAVKELSGPMMGLMQDQFGNLQQLLGSIR